MKIIVNNQHEAELIKRFLDAGHELGITDLMEEQDAKFADDEQLLNNSEYRILSEAVFWGDTTIEIDSSEPELEYEDGNWVEGECAHCGTVTTGIAEWMDRLTYSDWVDMNSEEYRKTWRCEDCHAKMCPNCGVKVMATRDDDECTDCIAERKESQ